MFETTSFVPVPTVIGDVTCRLDPIERLLRGLPLALHRKTEKHGLNPDDAEAYVRIDLVEYTLTLMT
jgi:hypothetical protein